MPPNEIVAGIMAAAQALRDGVDGELATLDPEDEWTQRLGPLVDAVDEQMIRVTEWLAKMELTP